MKEYLKDINKIKYSIWRYLGFEDIEIIESIREMDKKIIITQQKIYEDISIFKIEVDIRKYGFVITDQLFEERKRLDNGYYDIIYLKNYKYDYKYLMKKICKNYRNY